MPLNQRATNKLQDFNVPVSYRVHEKERKFLDARNVQSVQKRLDTRFGSSRYNATALNGAIQSISFFTKSDGSRYLIAKAGSDLVSVSEAGSHTVIKADLDLNIVHRGVTGNDRHIISIGSDGLFSWDGTTFSILGQEAPPKPTVAISGGGSLLDTNKYRVGLTFYSTQTGFETNLSEASDEVTASMGNLKITVSDIPETANNLTIDRVWIYLKNTTENSEWHFVGELNLGVADTYEIGEEPASSQTPPITHGTPLEGGGKYLTFFNSRLIYSGSTEYPNEVYFSEPDLPDAYNPLDDQLTLVIPGKGPVTGLAVGLFGDSVLDPFLVIFKGKSTRVYSEIGGLPKMVTLSEEIGCVSHDTIQVKNGVVYFLSEEGWRAIANGRFVTNRQGEAITLGNGDIDDIFKSSGFTYEVNRLGLSQAFSVYYPTLDQYMTWVREASNFAFTKTYVYEFDVGGFKPWEFAVPATCAVLGENSDGRDVVFFGTSDGYILKHSIMEELSDVDANGDTVAIDAFAVYPWIPEDGDFDATYNYRELILKAINSSSPLTVRTFVNYDMSEHEAQEYDFASSVYGFVLDESTLDEDAFGDERAIKTARADLNRVGESLAIGFYQSAIGVNIGLVAMQIDLSKNGNRNLGNDGSDDEEVFDTETGTYFPSVSHLAQEINEIYANIQSFFSNLGNVTFSGYSARFGEMWESNGVEDTFSKILQITYAPPTVSLSASPSASIREKGTLVSSVDLTANTTKFSADITQVTFFRNGSLIHTDLAPDPSGTVSSLYTDSTPFSDTTSFFARVTDGTDESTSNTITYSFVYPYYYGKGAQNLDASGIVANLTKAVIASSSSVSVTSSPTSEHFYFCYPSSYPALSSILDQNGFETISAYTVRTVTITGLDGIPVSYRVYELIVPTTQTNFTNTYIR